PGVLKIETDISDLTGELYFEGKMIPMGLIASFHRIDLLPGDYAVRFFSNGTSTYFDSFHLTAGENKIIKVPQRSLSARDREDLERLQGRWVVVSQEMEGKPVPDRVGLVSIEFVGNSLRRKRKADGAEWQVELRLNATDYLPAQIDLDDGSRGI